MVSVTGFWGWVESEFCINLFFVLTGWAVVFLFIVLVLGSFGSMGTIVSFDLNWKVVCIMVNFVELLVGDEVSFGILFCSSHP